MEKELQEAFDLIQAAVNDKKITGHAGLILTDGLNQHAKEKGLPLKFRLVTIEDRVSELIYNLKGDESESSSEEESSSDF